jgi:hypothetical protein
LDYFANYGIMQENCGNGIFFCGADYGEMIMDRMKKCWIKEYGDLARLDLCGR